MLCADWIIILSLVVDFQQVNQPSSSMQVSITPEVSDIYNRMRVKQSNKWAMFKIENNKLIVDGTGDECHTETREDDKIEFDKLKEKLTKEPRYLLYIFGFKNSSGKVRKTLAFIVW